MAESRRNIDLASMRNMFNDRFGSIIEGRLFFTMEEPFEDLLRRTGALLEGHFVLSSGLHSPYYVQCARTLQYPKYAEALGGVSGGQVPGLRGGCGTFTGSGGPDHRPRDGAGARCSAGAVRRA